MTQVQGSLSACAWFAVAAQVMARAKSLPPFSVQSSAGWTGAAVEGWRDTGNYKSQGALPGAGPCQWQRGPARLRARRLPPLKSGARGSLRAGSCLFPWAAPNSWASSAFWRCVRSLRAGWKTAGPVPMDAILNCSPEDLEDYYNLLGCDELSTVRASASSPAYPQFDRARGSAGNIWNALGAFFLATCRISLGKFDFSLLCTDMKSLE